MHYDTFPFWALTISSIICIFLLAWPFWKDYREQARRHREQYHLPILCVCEVNGRVGVVLKSDHQKSTQQFWQQYYDGTVEYDAFGTTSHLGKQIEVDNVFVFDPWSAEYRTLVAQCYLEQAEFYVPSVPAGELNPIREAWQHILTKPWNGTLLSTH